MKRVYRNSDIVFKVSDTSVSLDFESPESKDWCILYSTKFKFYTVNPLNCIVKTGKDSLSKERPLEILLEWNELSQLEEGVLNCEYQIGTDDYTTSDGTYDKVYKTITDYYIVSGKKDVNVGNDTVQWGKITGDILNQTDLIKIVTDKVTELREYIDKYCVMTEEVNQNKIFAAAKRREQEDKIRVTEEGDTRESEQSELRVN